MSDEKAFTYRIVQRMTTLSILYEEFEYHGFRISPWKYEPSSGSCGQGWTVEKAITASDASTAYQEFSIGFMDLVDRIGFVSQCYTRAEHEPFIVHKLDDNPENIFFINYGKQRAASPLHFTGRERTALESLDQFTEKGMPFLYLREAGVASSFVGRIVMLASAVEGIAGEIISKGKKQTNKEYIRAHILTDPDLYDLVFKYGTGVRNTLAHGGNIEKHSKQLQERDLSGEVYEMIVNYFEKKHGIRLNRKAKNPLRNPLNTFDIWRSWIKPRDPKNVPHELLPIVTIFAKSLSHDDHSDVESWGANYVLLDSAGLGF